MRRVTEDSDFTREEDEELVYHATQVVAPIFEMYFLRMQNVVRELLSAKIIYGERVKKLLQLGLYP